ncbi:hypothetical protein RJ639_025883 [Escallonia herrerae]|uniref:DUF4283 domain-containing protein n=1 Tax=Escallonia herrerae TaxID=1293975 RepID=A0AA89ABH8_9ASTE|nr:hypothetical protein RJ639_025883 [Escallonia herrerae]
MANLQLELDALISKTNQLLCKDTLELEEDTNNANKEYPLTLLAKIISNKKVNAKAVQSILFKAWNPNKGMKIQLMEENCFCITFNHDWDRTRVLESRPWSIMSSHMVVRDWPPDLTLKEINFNLSPFWIRICGLPPNQMTKANATKIADNIGALLEVDFTANGKIAWCKYLRIRVKIDVRKPIQTDWVMLARTAPLHRYSYQKTCPIHSDLGLERNSSHQFRPEQHETHQSNTKKTAPHRKYPPRRKRSLYPPQKEHPSTSILKLKTSEILISILSRWNNSQPKREDLTITDFEVALDLTTHSDSPTKHTTVDVRFCCVPSTGSKRLVGGLCLAWKEGIDLEISFSSQNIVNALVFSDPPDNP